VQISVISTAIEHISTFAKVPSQSHQADMISIAYEFNINCRKWYAILFYKKKLERKIDRKIHDN
jgi:hypothetical protein